MMPPSLLRPLLLVFALVALGACRSIVPPNLRPPENPTNTIDMARKTLEDASPCCGSFADLSYQDMLPWQPQRFELNKDSPVASLNGDRSYFLAFRLPQGAQLPYTIAMKSELNGRWLSSSYLFAPTVVLLDDAFQPLHSEDIQLCEYIGWTSETTGAFGKFKVVDEVLDRLAADGAEVDRTDGARVSTADGWWLLRASNTQDVLVARAEAKDEAGLERLMGQINDQLARSGVEPVLAGGH